MALVLTSGPTSPIIGEPGSRSAAEVCLSDQTSTELANLDRIVTAAAGRRADIVSVMILHTQRATQNIVNARGGERLADSASLVEISAVAAP